MRTMKFRCTELDMNFGRTVNNFLKAGYPIRKVQFYDAPNKEVYRVAESWDDLDLRQWQEDVIISVEYYTEINVLRIYTC